MNSVRIFSSISSKLTTSDEIKHLLYTKGHLKEAFSLLFSNILKTCCIPTTNNNNNSLSLLKQTHSLIITSGCSSNKFISNHLLNIYSKNNELNTVLSLYHRMPKKNVMSFNILINGYVQKGDLVVARKVFDEMSDRNVATWNAMIAGFIQFEFNEEGLELFRFMRVSEFLPDEFCLGSVLRGCAGLRDLSLGQQVHVYVIKCALEGNLVVGCSLAHMYMRCRRLVEGEKVITSFRIRNVIAWNTLIAGYAQNGYSEGVLDLFNLMKKAGLKPDKVTFVSVLSSCSDLATLGQGQQIHAETIKAGANSVMAVVSSLISLYSKCGCLEDSVKVFTERESADSVLWSSMITAYGFHGHGEEAIRLFERMKQEELEIGDVTFLSLLYACSHSGLKEKGKEFFAMMTERYGLKPRLEHYTCMVDLLGRSGCLDEAELMIRTMPINPDVIIWKTLISACKIHNNVDFAKRISEEILKFDPNDASSYVLLANIHASAKKWQDVSELRKAMRDRNVRKEPGISWLELKNQIHQFSKGDKSHLQSTEIDLYLKELIAELKLHGYVPDTSSVLHDMENEEKEYHLTNHSEKLAIAFGLMNVPEGVPIRIMKNLRVCDDCHIVFKFISKIKNREIIVRDASRFHHFKEGRCSCGDYW